MRVFDGVAVVDSTQVLVQAGKITAIGQQIEAPPTAEVINGAGLTLLPGLIDSHVHAFGPVLTAALVMGVSTELDMFTMPEAAAVLREEQERGEGLDRADLFSAGYLVTAPGGHGTEYGFEIPTLTAPEQADAFVQARIEEGSDYIKIVVGRRADLLLVRGDPTNGDTGLHPRRRMVRVPLRVDGFSGRRSQGIAGVAVYRLRSGRVPLPDRRGSLLVATTQLCCGAWAKPTR